jgi:hypothetical protein
LPERISSNRFVQYSIDYPYLALQVSQRWYVLFTETDYSKCITSTVTVCAMNAAIFNTHQRTCEISLFFQTANHQHLCKINLFLNYQRPTLIRHGKLDIQLPDATPANVTLAGNCSGDLPHWNTHRHRFAVQRFNLSYLYGRLCIYTLHYVDLNRRN